MRHWLCAWGPGSAGIGPRCPWTFRHRHHKWELCGRFWRPSRYSDVEAYVRRCENCAPLAPSRYQVNPILIVWLFNLGPGRHGSRHGDRMGVLAFTPWRTIVRDLYSSMPPRNLPGWLRYRVGSPLQQFWVFPIRFITIMPLTMFRRW